MRSRQQARPYGCWGLNSEACGEFERREDHPGHPGDPVHAISAWSFQVHGKARVRTRVVRFDPQAPCQDFFNMLTLILSEADGSKPKKES